MSSRLFRVLLNLQATESGGVPSRNRPSPPAGPRPTADIVCLACTDTTDPSIIRKSACCTPSPPTSREASVPTPADLRAILSISSM
jgi:hypothetical protein